ncbi:MAG: agmatinase [Planctomycetota bacterium]
MKKSKKSYTTFLGIEKKYADFKTAKFVIILLPFEKTTSFQKGTKNGPYKLLEASYQVELFDEELLFEPYKVGIATKTFLYQKNVPVEGYLKKVEEYTYTHILSYNKIPIAVGGEHTVSIPLIASIKRKYSDLSVLHLDAHSDLRNEYENSPFNHACAARRWSELGVNTVQLGIRNISKEEYDFYLHNKDILHIFFAREILNEFNPEKILQYLKDNVYITIDLDGFDISVIRGTGTPEPGGLLWYPTLKILEYIIKNRNVVGFDIMELMPLGEEKISEFVAAKLCYKLIAYYTYHKQLPLIQ